MKVIALSAAVAALALTSLSGCYHPYQPPRPNEPHAVLKIRRVYEAVKGTSLRETATIGEDHVFTNAIGVDAMSPQNSDALLVHPRRALFQVENLFYHQESRMVNESYTVSVPYSTTESYSCGDYKSYRTCTRSVTQYRSEYRTRNVMRTVDVRDGGCMGSVALHPQVGHVYLLQYTYRDDQQCSLDCYEQTSSADGQLTQTPCPVPPPSKPR